MVNGMPEPAWVSFVADKRPHLLHLSFASALNVYGNLLRVQRTQQRAVTDSSTTACFLSSLSTVVGLRGSDRAVSRTPLALRLMSIICCFTSDKQPRLR